MIEEREIQAGSPYLTYNARELSSRHEPGQRDRWLRAANDTLDLGLASVYRPPVRRDIARLFASSIAAKRAFLRHSAQPLADAVTLIANALRGGHKLLLFGNGGSAADAQHIAAEFVNRFKIERPPLAAIALTTDTSALTSIANDYGYAEVFAKQVQALGQPGDVALAISTSGNARSVLRAVEACRARGVRTIALTGGSGGKLAPRADLVLCVASTTETARIQETHILIGHVICELVDQILYGARTARKS